jgi:hypothetical protein
MISTMSSGSFAIFLWLRLMVTPGRSSVVIPLASLACVSFSSRAAFIASRTTLMTWLEDNAGGARRLESDVMLGSFGRGGIALLPAAAAAAAAARRPCAGFSGNPLPTPGSPLGRSWRSISMVLSAACGWDLWSQKSRPNVSKPNSGSMPGALGKGLTAIALRGNRELPARPQRLRKNR